MLLTSIIAILLSNAVNSRRDVSILYNRVAIIVLVYCILNDLFSLSVITKGVGLHGGLLLVTNITQVFHIFIYIIGGLILVLTSFYPRKV
jgi:NADH-ubiquinone oxidoreductase chain 2